MSECKECGKNIGFWTDKDGFCGKCFQLHGATISREERLNAEKEERLYAEAKLRAQNMLVTTEMFCPDLKIIERKGVVTAEIVVGMNLFKDMFAGIRNLVGGRSGVVQDALRDIRVQVIDELKMEADRYGANAVVAIDLDYQEIGATGSTMLMLVASGTAVIIED